MSSTIATCPAKVVVHPLVLLSVVDHFTRMKKIGSEKRIVGALLGCLKINGVVDVSNSFAVPFDEDENDKSIWFLDHDYLENMYGMFKKVNAREKVVGWYHSGPKLQSNDILVNELVKKYAANSVLVIVDVQPSDSGLPTEAYRVEEQIHEDGSPAGKTFIHLPSEIGAEEAEEVGVEHLLRDINDTSFGSLTQRISSQLSGLTGMKRKLIEVQKYLAEVEAGEMPVNHEIMYNVQKIFNLLPNVCDPNFIEAMNVKTNDQMLCMYLASLTRTVLGLDNLINNKITLRESEKKEAKRQEEKLEDLKDEKKEKVEKIEKKEKELGN